MAETRVVLFESDDGMHPNTGEPNFNESAYYNFYDPRVQAGGFVRLGNRPNEGYAEMTACFYLPGGRVAFWFGRPEIQDNARHDAGGLRFEIVRPFAEHRIEYRGPCLLLADPLEMADPRKAFRNHPQVPVELELRWLARSAAWGGELRTRTGENWTSAAHPDPEHGFARGHFEQHGKSSGVLRVGDERFDLDAPGLRDRSWGPRSWQAPKAYRWLTMNFGEDLGAVPLLWVAADGGETHGGYVYRQGRQNEAITRVEIDTETRGEHKLHDRIHVRARTAGGELLEIQGQVLAMVPLRNRRQGRVTRIAEGLTEWHWSGRVGYGLSEYLDQLEEGL
jgi:hypothetical protein